MKRIQLIAIIALISTSCGKPERIVKDNKEFVVIGGDTLGVVYETHIVKSCDVIQPKSIHEEMNVKFKVVLEDGTFFSSLREYNVGDSIIYTIYQK